MTSRFKHEHSSFQNILSFSGGKDSTACYLLYLKHGIPFRAVFADTGHEHEKTLEFIIDLPKKTGGPVIEIIRADFTKRFEKKRETIATKWSQDGVSQDRVEQALRLFKPTGIPFLDLCMLKGRFPSTKARFCTEELKSLPMLFQVYFPALKNGKGPVVNIQGVRAQESQRRAKMSVFERGEAGVIIYRPIFHWDHQRVFDIHREMSVEPNPLYKLGFNRVGCMPCIMCQKSEIAIMARRFPEHVQRVKEWEKIVSEVSKRGISTFFPEGTAPYPAGYNPEVSGYYGIDEIVKWSKTTHGGRQQTIEFAQEEALCESKYGLCE